MRAHFELDAPLRCGQAWLLNRYQDAISSNDIPSAQPSLRLVSEHSKRRGTLVQGRRWLLNGGLRPLPRRTRIYKRALKFQWLRLSSMIEFT
jgi:hypothetical protein